MRRWSSPVLARLPDYYEKACLSDTCVEMYHRATYQIETTNTFTGVVVKKYICTKAAAALASKHKVPFPPGVTLQIERGV